MATGIVSAALRQAGQLRVSAVLLAIAVAAFAVLAAVSLVRGVVFPADLRADLTGPDRAFTGFAFVAACDVLGSRLAEDGHTAACAALAVAALAAWLALSCLVPGRLIARPRSRPAISAVSGNWYLWTVGTQSLAIVAVFLLAAGVIEGPAAGLATVVAWSAGTLLYLGTSVLVAARLLTAGLGPDEPTAPYWVAMGAASISVLAAAEILLGPGSGPVRAARPALTGLATGLWILATGLILPLVARSLWRHRPGRAPLRYRGDLWMIVFPAGMYATASLQLGTAAGRPLVHDLGQAAVWPAAVAWALVFAAMAASALAAFRPGQEPEPQAHRPAPH